MIRPTSKTEGGPEPQSGQPAASGEGWLGRNTSEKRRMWERLNPRHRKELRMLAELDRVIRRIAAILAELARRTPPAG